MTEPQSSDEEASEPQTRGTSEAELRRMRMSNDEIADQARRIIDEAIQRNVLLEISIVVILVSVALVGIFLLLSGAADRRWELLASGSSCAVAVGWPVSRLVGMWKFNLALKTLPAIIRMSDTKGRQEMRYRFVGRLIDKL